MASKFLPRRAKPGEAFEEWDAEGKRHTFSADAKGVVRPSNAFEAAVLERRGLPTARKAAKPTSSAPAGRQRRTRAPSAVSGPSERKTPTAGGEE